jgi:hypothetical protein
MQNEQPLALKLADDIENRLYDVVFEQVVAELRRLHAENEVLHQQLKQQEPSTGGIIFAVEQAIRNGDCPWEIESAFDDYESERIAIAQAGEVK